MENNQTAARAAKRFLDDLIRNDWAFPDLPPHWEHSDEEVRNAVSFRDRYYGESDSSDSDIEPRTGAHDAYKFDSPDAVADTLDQTRATRRKRRRMRLEEEMAENEGLRVWVERRDAWTGVASVRKYGCAKGRPASPLPQHDSGNGVQDSMQMDVSPSTADTHQPTTTQPDAITDTSDLCPVASPLLPSNPIRDSINPKVYSDIYAKCVTSSRTPSVPINLSHMTAALVQGWKETNEWPPKIGPVDPLAGRKRAALGGGLLGSKGVLGGGREGAGRGEGGFIQRHPHLEKGVGSVKKILHLSGHADAAKEG